MQTTICAVISITILRSLNHNYVKEEEESFNLFIYAKEIIYTLDFSDNH